LNTIILIVLGKYATSSFAYPFSNGFIRKSHMRSTNVRYGTEFQSTVERITKMIKDMTENKNYKSGSKIMEGKSESEHDDESDLKGATSSH